MFTHLDLFSGIGGFSLGLGATGKFKTIGFCEIEPFCQKVLAKHWPNVPIFSDIRTLNGNTVRTVCGSPDLITGGFPCQDISTAGKQAGLSGSRSSLWWELHRLICELRPTWALIENVPNLRTKGADDVLDSLEREGYACTASVVGAWAVGAWHKRDRVWILAHSESQRVQGLWAERLEIPTALVEKKVSGGSGEGDVCHASSSGLPDWAGGPLGQPSPLTEFERPDGREIERDFRGVAHGVSRRVDRLKSLGNAIVPQLATLFGEFIARSS